MNPEIEAPMHKNKTTTMGRISGFISKNNVFKNINLSSKLYGESVPFTNLTRFGVPIPTPPLPAHGAWKEWPFDRVIQQEFGPATVGESFGPTWATHWFKVEFTVPSEWKGKQVHLRWTTGSESTLYSADGKLIQGLNPKFREMFVLPADTTSAVYYIEMACNHIMGAGPDFVNGWGDEITPPSPNLFFKLTVGDIAIFNEEVFQIYTDLEMLHGMADKMGENHIGYQAMFVANQIVNYIRVDKYDEARAIAKEFFSQGSGKKSHTLHAIGHCHIDSAWLWPYSEAIRKCARSFSSQLLLMKEYPQFTFAVSSAQQLAWMKEYYPDLYADIKTFVAGTKQFIPVGGSWIELDGNIPSGESFMRQYFYGQQFFRREFGITSLEFWLPDTFGYSAQIPQMLKHVGIDRFITQKMSWNLVNRFPNHCFMWEGIDGSRVMCHFPPGDSYGMSGTVEEILKSRDNSEDKGRCNKGIYLFGHGDGGGGPTREIIERLLRVQNVDGLPNIQFSTPNTFFEEMEKDKHKFYKWVGELYLEMHNGTYTSQAKIKWYNRKGEFFLREVEELMCIAAVLGKIDGDDLKKDIELVDKNWQQLLLNQFHDVLPGSCIQIVAEDAWEIYEEVFASLKIIREKYHRLILGNAGSNMAIYNPLSWPVKTVVFMKPDNNPPPTGVNTQLVSLNSTEFENQIEGRYRVPNTFSAALVELAPSGYSSFKPIASANTVSFTNNKPSQGTGTFSNGIIMLETSTVETEIPTEQLFFNGSLPAFKDFLNIGVVPGRLYIYDDLPVIWDAWDVMDYHLETRREPIYTNSKMEIISVGPIVGCYKWSAEFGNGSSVIRYTIMRADSPMIEYYTIVDWKEEHKMLKVEFPVDVLSREATFEIQYGHTKRPTHINTSWDMAKFEVCGHKWMDISQADKGVTVITDSKYGWHVRDNLVQLSLLRSPKNPDANCDMHKHFIYYAVLPHTGSFQEADAIRAAYELNFFGANNVPLIANGLAAAELPHSWVTTNQKAVVVEALKVAAEIPNALCVRLYESFGGYANATISLGFSITKVEVCNGLEDIIGDYPSTGNSFTVPFKPFQIQSFLVYF